MPADTPDCMIGLNPEPCEGYQDLEIRAEMLRHENAILGAKIKSDAKVIAALRESLQEIVGMPPKKTLMGGKVITMDAEQQIARKALDAIEQNVGEK
jgi:hypothetical protein